VAIQPLAAEAAAPAFRPQKPTRPDEVGLSTNRLADLLLKHLYFKSPMSGQEWAVAIHLPFAVLAAAVQNLIEQNLCQKLGRVASAASGQDFGETMGYQLSEQGRIRAQELLERDHYVGPAPVRFVAYETSIREQAVDIDVNRSRLTSALSHLVLSDELLAELGPPIASRAPMFLYGAPGNGKTSIAEACAGLLGDPHLHPLCRGCRRPDGARLRPLAPSSRRRGPSRRPALGSGRSPIRESGRRTHSRHAGRDL
jgi:hypothetical protein